MLQFYVSKAKKQKQRNSNNKNFLDCISKYESPLKYNKNILILKQIVMADEKCILYNNVDWERFGGKWKELPSTKPKSSLHPKNVMLYTW